ncbi:imidazole glycerol phosphate synthase subunit HisF [Candidatus Deianiraea vastatrix]|uniref:Imidazole glycerol phosphate synthase subunit HisF n=1 Tax=Candidatus Deianiraea vastatrix TaxID=2163644 RepID=A0A5B8XEE7_9RICK|nr:imidazole glycerol phosphate synthase subunit HisF [Candidatus Deianiraea vastatrix]QED23620.1 Imidazole glycerol phosphate synthase subunit HisF [Candidatus Deianiraea vastatrix]
MTAKRIIACLDIADGKVVKGVKFQNHEIIGDIVPFAQKYSDAGIDELVLYDIKASCDDKTVDYAWIESVAKVINIPFCVAGKIDSIAKVEKILNCGADKVSINSPAINNPDLINQIADKFGSSTLVVGIDTKDGFIYKNTGDNTKTQEIKISVLNWACEAAKQGAGEIVINSINSDGTKQGYDINLLKTVVNSVKIPVIASGGAGIMQHFKDVFMHANVSGALAASVFHKNEIDIKKLKEYLVNNNILIRI